MRALAERAQARGARLELGEADPEGGAVRVGERMLEGDAVVWACGAWLARLFPELVSLRVTLQQVALFEAGPEWAGAGWVDFDGPWYGHGAIEPHGFKVAHDVDGPPVDPDARPLEASEQAVRAAREYLAMRFPGLADAPVASAPACHYSLTPDSNFLFAAHPGEPGVWLLGGGSGHGFKHGPALAEHVAVRAGRPRGAGAALRARRAPPRAQPAHRGVLASRERAPPPAAAGARHRGHPGLDRGPGAAAGGDRQGVRRLARRGRAGALGAGRHGRGGVARRSGRSSTAGASAR